MTLALVLVIFVSTSELQAPSTVALRHAAQEVLGNDSQVRLRGYLTAPDDNELAEQGEHADAVAEITWQDAARRHALVHCYLGHAQRYVDRELVFDADDELPERGRMLGFAIASMLPEVERDEQPTAKPTRTARPVKTTEAAPYPAAAALREPDSQRPRGAIEATALGAVGVGDPGGGLGVGLAGRWFFHRALSLRLSTGLRAGEVAVAQAKSTAFFGGLGLGFQLTSPELAPRFVFGGRADALLTATTLRRARAIDDIPETQTRLQPAADLLLEGAWYFLNSTALLLASGGEFTLGHTDLVVRGKEVGDIATFRFIAELGVRAGF